MERPQLGNYIGGWLWVGLGHGVRQGRLGVIFAVQFFSVRERRAALAQKYVERFLWCARERGKEAAG